MSILRGTIFIHSVGAIPAEFSDRTITNKDFPDGFDYFIDWIAFSKDEESGEIVFSPYSNSRLNVVEDGNIFYYNIKECVRIFDVSIFSFIDLFVEKNKEELTHLVDQAIMSREYTEDQI